MNPRKSAPAAFLSVFLVLVCFGFQARQAVAQTTGQWSAVQTWPTLAAHASLLPNGKVVFWPTFGQGDEPQIWDPATNGITSVSLAGFNVFCAGHTFLPNGTLFVAGGHNGASGYGLPNAAIFDSSTNSWTQKGSMWAGRWYPTTTTMLNGNVLVSARL